jgi:surface polysaccharide O-acyltransferase-like enzyme
MNVTNDHDQKKRLAVLDAMRAVAIVMVVALHALGYCRELPKTTHAVISFIVHTISVPVFFLVDGYLFARMNAQNPNVAYWSYVKKSSTRLLIPWLIFTIGYTVIRYIFELNNFFQNKLVVNQPILDVVKHSYGSVIAPQLYFLFSLFLIRLIAPLTSNLFKINRYAVLFVCGMYILFYRLPVNQYLVPYLRIEGGQEPILHAFWGLQFYLVGIVLYLFKGTINNAKAFYIFSSVLLISFLITVPGTVAGIKSVTTQYLYLLSFYFGISLLPENIPVLGSVGTNTMGIYLLHAPIMLKAASMVINHFVNTAILSYVALTFVVFLISYYLTIIINRVPYGSLLFGAPIRKNQFAESRS